MWSRRSRKSAPASPAPPSPRVAESPEDVAARKLRALVAYGRAVRQVLPPDADATGAYVCGVGMTPSHVLEAAADLGDASDEARRRPEDPDTDAALLVALDRFKAAVTAAPHDTERTDSA